MKEALSWTKEWRSGKCILETDSKLLVDAVTGVRGLSYFDPIAADVQEWSRVAPYFIHCNLALEEL